MKTVWVYVNTTRDVGDADYLKVFTTKATAEARFGENDPEGVAFEYEVIGAPATPTPRSCSEVEHEQP
jgi:hypothetical protein